MTRQSNGTSRAHLARVGAAVCCLALAACSIPQAIDPRRLFADEVPTANTEGAAETRAQAEAETAAAGDQPFPSLASVPDRPSPPTPRQIRDRVLEGLVADRRNARYTDEAIRLRDSAEARPTVLATRPVTAAAPAVARPPATSAPQTAAVAPPTPAATPRATPPAADEPIRPAALPVSTPLSPAEVAPAALESRTAAITPPALAAPSPPARRQDVDPFVDRAKTFDAFDESVQLATIQFGHNSSRLNDADRDILRQVAIMALQEGAAIKVIGHSSLRTAQTDAARAQLANLEASIKRANAVAEALVAFGVDPGRVVVEAKSDQEPMYRETASTGEAGNRRAEVFLIR